MEGAGKMQIEVNKMITLGNDQKYIVYKEKHGSMFHVPVFRKKHQRIIYNDQFNAPYDSLNWIPSHAKNFH